METVLAFLEQVVRQLTGPAIGGLFVALGIVLAARLWSLQIIGMAVVYFTVGLLHARVIRPEIVLVKWVIGAAICLAFAFTPSVAEAAGNARARPEISAPRFLPGPVGRMLRRLIPRLPDDLPLRLVALLAALIIAYAGSLRFPLPQVSFEIGVSCYLMAVVGLFLAGMSEDPLQVGLGLLVFLNGFDLFFGALEPSLVVVGLLGTLEVLVALAVTHAAVSRLRKEP